MSEEAEQEQGPDANDVRRHAKRMLTELEYRKRYRRIDFYRPNGKQLVFHNLIADERSFRAGNQQGKTHGGAAQLTFNALGLYPDWYEGRRFVEPPAIERPFDFLAWVASTTSTTTRDGAQTKLLGDIRQQDGLGTGLIPLDNILGRPTMARGISDFVDSVTLRRESGGRAAIRFKTFEMDRKAFQGEACDEVWLDEDPGDDVVYGECLARIVATRGQIIFTSTPTLGVTPVRKRFKERLPGTAEILMTIDDATHIPAEERQRIVSRYKASERATRAYGADMQGEGAVFEIPVESITHSRDPATFPPYWPWLWAVDFSHGGMSSSAHAFAAVLGCWDRDADVIYIVHAIRMRQALPIQHVAAIKAHPCWDARVAWPHDGGISGFESAETFAGTYKRHGQARGFFAECEDERVVDFNADRDRGRGGRSMFELDGRHARNVLRLWCFTFWVNFANEDRTKRCMAGAAHSCHELARGYSTPLVTLFFFPWCSVSSGGAVKSSNLSLGFASGLFVDRRQFAWRGRVRSSCFAIG